MKELVAHPLTLAAFGAILSEEIDWKPFPAFPPSARLAVVVGEPSENGAVHGQSEGPAGREADAASPSGRPGVHGDLRHLLHRSR